MHRGALLVFVAFAVVPLDVRAEPAPQVRPVALASAPQFEAAHETRRARLAAGIKPTVLPKLAASIQEVRKRAEPQAAPPGKPPPPAPDLAAVARASASALARTENVDIEALVQLVLLEAAKEADRDLKAALAEIKAANERKAALRAAAAAMKAAREAAKSPKACASLACLDTLPKSAEYTDATMASVKQSLQAIAEKDREDKLGDLTQEQQLKLQLAQDRRSKMFEALSNLLKKISDTAQSITQNLK